jgi:RHS repeat-associated protein
MQSAPILGYTIQTNDYLLVAQYQNSRGGPMMQMSDGSYCLPSDQDGQVMLDDSFQNVWHNRRFDLSGCAGKSITSFVLNVDSRTPAGAWQAYYQSITLFSADGTVHPIYNRGKTVSLSVQPTSGVGQVSYQVQHVSGLGSVPQAGTTYYHSDHLQSARILTDYWGYPIWQGTFLPFGQEWNPEITTNHYKFTGKERDAESGLDFFGARFYSSTMGRWMSPDWADKPEPVPYAVLNNPQSLNLFGYVLNNPLFHADLDGHKVGDKYSTLDLAGTAAVQEVQGKSRTTNREYGGWVKKNMDGTFSYSKAMKGTEDHVPNHGKRPDTAEAQYHTHGSGKDKAFDNEHFSPQD